MKRSENKGTHTMNGGLWLIELGDFAASHVWLPEGIPYHGIQYHSSYTMIHWYMGYPPLMGPWPSIWDPVNPVNLRCFPQPLFITECNMTSQVSTMRSPQTVHKDVAWHTKSHQTATTYDLGTFPPPIPSHHPLKKMGFSLMSSHPAIGILLL